MGSGPCRSEMKMRVTGWMRDEMGDGGAEQRLPGGVLKSKHITLGVLLYFAWMTDYSRNAHAWPLMLILDVVVARRILPEPKMLKAIVLQELAFLEPTS
ncbi:hypothetical protein ACH5RR_008659 [Cinchona calisaya]|uniref:Uncharacterized protein n=1 Tax=Cinchona calisaya TaxID=153742 RepID=A0ABD3AFT3_9GENT